MQESHSRDKEERSLLPGKSEFNTWDKIWVLGWPKRQCHTILRSETLLQAKDLIEESGEKFGTGKNSGNLTHIGAESIKNK